MYDICIILMYVCGILCMYVCILNVKFTVIIPNQVGVAAQHAICVASLVGPGNGPKPPTLNPQP